MISTTQQACIDTINPEHPNHGPHCGGPSTYVDSDLIGTLTPYFFLFFFYHVSVGHLLGKDLVWSA